MRFSNSVSPVGGSYGTAVGGWSTGGGQPEKVFGVFRNSYTKTATITAASFVRGAPCILTAASASNNGYDVINADTMGQVSNELFVGCVADYPDTTAGKTGVWQPEDFGIVQVYGIVTNGIVSVGTVSIAAGLLLSPDTASQFQTIPQLRFPSVATIASTDTAAFTARSGVAGLAVLYQTIASSSASGTVAASIWLRSM